MNLYAGGKKDEDEEKQHSIFFSQVLSRVVTVILTPQCPSTDYLTSILIQ